jgi:hypothetical protein
MIAGETPCVCCRNHNTAKKTVFSGKVPVLQGICTQFAAMTALCGQKRAYSARPQDKLETTSCAAGNICMRWKRVAVRALYFFRRNHCYAREVPQFLAFMPKIHKSITTIA